MHSGLVFNIQRYSIHDGPGIRTTVFLKGCPLHCWWCHNPESQAFEPEISIAENRCLRCGDCWEACPQQNTSPMRKCGEDAATDRGGVERPSLARRARVVAPLMDRERCIRCGACVTACSAGARQLVGRRMRIGEVLEEVLKDRIFYDESGGGVTFSGGEPLTQAEFVRGLLEAARGAGVHTSVDTCGYARREHLLSVVPTTDLFLYDLKIMDDERHQQYTGVSNSLILDNLRLLGREHGNIWIRIPIIPGFNDDPKHVQEAARFAVSVHGVKQINLLPYHETGSHKNERLGRPNPFVSVQPPSAEQMEALADGIRDLGVPIYLGG